MQIRDYNFKIVDVGIEQPSLETEEGIVYGPSSCYMIVETDPDTHKHVDIDKKTYENILYLTE